MELKKEKAREEKRIQVKEKDEIRNKVGDLIKVIIEKNKLIMKDKYEESK